MPVTLVEVQETDYLMEERNEKTQDASEDVQGDVRLPVELALQDSGSVDVERDGEDEQEEESDERSGQQKASPRPRSEAAEVGLEEEGSRENHCDVYEGKKHPRRD